MDEDKKKNKKQELEPAANCDQSILPQRIESLIHVIRNHKVMLDSDLARLYGVETKALNQAVKRNIQRFPDDFMFQLTSEECLRSQFVTLKDLGKRVFGFKKMEVMTGTQLLAAL